MGYCTLTDLLGRMPERTLIQLTDDTDDQAAVNEAVVDGVIESVGEFIDGHLRGRLPLPLAEVPGLIREIALDLAVYDLYSRRPEVDIPDGVAARRKEAVRSLEKIQAGTLDPGLGADEDPRPSGEFKTNKTDDDRVFNSDLLDLF